MSDPFSIAASAASFLSLGIQVAGSLIQYYQDIRDCPTDVANIKNRLKTFKTALENLQSVLRHYESKQDGSLLQLELNSSIEDCDFLVEKLQKRCIKICGTPITKWEKIKQKSLLATYPLLKSTFVKLNEYMDAVQTNISFMLDILGLRDNRQLLLDVAKTKRLLDLVLGTQLERDVHTWFKAPDATIDKNAADMKRHEGTGQWFIKGAEFLDWLQRPNSFLWMNGIAGCGKSVLSSTVIDAVASKLDISNHVGITFIYLTFTDTSKQDVIAILKTFILQLCGQSTRAAEELKFLYDRYKTGSPSIMALKKCFQKVKSHFKEVFMIVDGIDESPQATSRRDVLALIKELRKDSSHLNTHLLVTSRDEIDIRRAWEPFKSGEDLRMQNRGIDDDIKMFIQSQLQNDEVINRKWKNHLEPIGEKLTQKSQGVFRWVECQFEAIRDCPHCLGDLENCLEGLPPTLDKTYERILTNISESRKERARRLLLMLCVAPEPMTVEALIEALALVLDENPHCDDRFLLQDGGDLLEICPGLIFLHRVSKIYLHENQYTDEEIREKENRATIVRIAHFSVQEFLHSSRIGSGPAAYFMVEPSSGNTEMAEICLAYLTQSKTLIPYESVADEAKLLVYAGLALQGLTRFAAIHWRRCLEGIDQLTDILRKSITVLFHPDFHGLQRLFFYSLFSENPLNPPAPLKIFVLSRGRVFGTPLHYALWSGIPWLVIYVLLKSTPIGLVASDRQETIFYDNKIDTVQFERLFTNRVISQASKHQLSCLWDLLRTEDNLAAILRPVVGGGMKPSAHSDSKICKAFRYRLDISLLWGASYRHIKLVTLLLDLGANVNATGDVFNHLFRELGTKCSQETEKVWLSYSPLMERSWEFQWLQRSDRQIIMQHMLSSQDRRAIHNLTDLAQAAFLCCETANPLQVAAYPPGDRKIVQMLLNAGADVNVQGGHYGTVLQTALRSSGNGEVVELLLDAGADANVVVGRFGTALNAASRNLGDVETVNLSLRPREDVNGQPSRCVTSLEDALQARDNLKMGKILLDAGAHAGLGSRSTPLVAAVSNNFDPRIIKLLLDAGANVNGQVGDSGSALHAAPDHRSPLEVVKILLDAGADVNAAGGLYGTPLQATAAMLSTDSPKLVKILLEAGAVVNALGGWYGTALQAACDYQSRGGFSRGPTGPETNLQVITILLEAGADVNIGGGEYGSAIHAAETVGTAEIVRLLRDAGAKETDGDLENISADELVRKKQEEMAEPMNLEIMRKTRSGKEADLNCRG